MSTIHNIEKSSMSFLTTLDYEETDEEPHEEGLPFFWGARLFFGGVSTVSSLDCSFSSAFFRFGVFK